MRYRDFRQLLPPHPLGEQPSGRYNRAIWKYFNALQNHETILRPLLQDIDMEEWKLYESAIARTELVRQLLKETEEEIDYELSHYQACKAVALFVRLLKGQPDAENSD